MKEKLFNACNQLDINLDDAKAEKILTYLFAMQKWNKVYNLTAIKNLDDMLIHHAIDSLSIIPVLAQSLKSGDLVLDVGSGGGLPGVIIAIMFPEVNVECVDAVEKKVTFIRQIAGTLKCHNLHAEHTRIENRQGEKAEVIISRAFASLEDFVFLIKDQKKVNGKVFAMKGIYPEKEIEDLKLKMGWKVKNNYELNVPFLDAKRCLIELEEEL
ncbi:16S rRNA (guanine(527)-N(7))-methyltransferase RsmG [Basilea psittacipulmonis]|uniref:16S rRNA (guanine(527)-N(7))-methyltransferase RsmG n=1 Tax=Basilea psittacipulmonis TaxID=1472345 RepID=UPI00130E4475|nr:16S rRNA (guanine(527)-N(7))-methyltransferase RsmG [Basilea psittacipulmonis]